jgi:Uma2 family endonuclease
MFLREMSRGIMCTMTALATISAKPFEIGTTGWTAADLDNRAIERLWCKGRYEIIEGVLTKMPPAFFDGSYAVQNLVFQVKKHLDQVGTEGSFAPEVDIILGNRRVVIADFVCLTPADMALQRQANAARKRKRAEYGRLLVPPTLIIESSSLDHEAHDSQTKRRYYAEFGVPNYWIINVYARTLECFVLDDGAYEIDRSGKGRGKVSPSMFPGLTIPLQKIWTP